MPQSFPRLKFSREVVFHEVEKDSFVGWNRFSPQLLKLNEGAIGFLQNLENNENTDKVFEAHPEFKDELLRAKFLFEENSDPSLEDFFNSIEGYYREIERKAEEFYRQEQDYSQLYIHNSVCNLVCRYCAKNYGYSNRIAKIPLARKKEILDRIADQYIERKIKCSRDLVTISLNGGEILLEWDLIKHLVLRNHELYPGLKFKYFVNTNMTLMTEEIAEFMSRYDFDLDISIDGYPESHDLSRIYKNGSGSFETIMKGLDIYRKYNPHSKIEKFQGTIENPGTFEPQKVYEMERFGFQRARLFPNLLNITAEEASQKAKIMGNFLAQNRIHSFKVADSFFEKLRKLVRKEDYQFSLNCMGLSTLPKIGIFLDITSLRLSQLCSYVSKPLLQMEEVGDDIYSPVLFDATRVFIRERLDALKTQCIACPIIGICRGDCVMSGLDCENRVNKAACAFQEEIWKLFLTHIYTHEASGLSR